MLICAGLLFVPSLQAIFIKWFGPLCFPSCSVRPFLVVKDETVSGS